MPLHAIRNVVPVHTPPVVLRHLGGHACRVVAAAAPTRGGTTTFSQIWGVNDVNNAKQKSLIKS